MDSELRLADGTPIRFVEAIDLKIEHDHLDIESLKPDFRSMFDTSFQATGSITSADIDAFMDLIPDHILEPQEVYYYVPKHRYWELQYLAQGKCYPRPRRSKSQVPHA